MSARYCYAPLPAGTRAKALPSGVVTGEPNAVPVLLTAPRSRHTLQDVRLFVVLDHGDDWPDGRGMQLLTPTVTRGEPVVILARTPLQARHVVARVSRGGVA